MMGDHYCFAFTVIYTCRNKIKRLCMKLIKIVNRQNFITHSYFMEVIYVSRY